MIRGKSWNDGWLTAYWGRESRGQNKELIFGCPSKSEGHLLNWVFSHAKMAGYDNKNFLQTLESYGYDLTTLQFSIKRKPQNRPAEIPVAY